MEAVMGFLRNNSNDHNRPAEKSFFAIEPGKHIYISGATGSGKTRLLGKMLREEILSGEKKGILVVDEKNVLHREIKHMAGDPSHIYQIGAPAFGRNDIRINLLELACPSPNKAKEFFRMQITSKSHGGKDGSADFWGNAAAKMAYSTYLFISSLKKILSYAKINGDLSANAVQITKTFKVGKDESPVIFRMDTEPLVFSELFRYFSDANQFRIISEYPDQLLEATAMLLRRCFQLSSLSYTTAGELDALLTDLHERATDMRQYILSENPAEASGNSGVWFTLQSSMPSSMTDSPLLNEKYPTHDIVSLLEEGKIVIVDSENTDKTVVGMILNALWDTLSLRSYDRHATPVICFVEEAPRVLNYEIKLEETLAFARESRLSIVLIAQGDSQIESVYGPQKTASIMNNVEIYRLSGKDRPMEKFTFMHGTDIYRFEPDFPEETELYSAELAYQTDTEQYTSVSRHKNEVVVYSDRLHSRTGKVALVDCLAMETRQVPYKTDTVAVEGVFSEMYRSYQEKMRELDLEPEPDDEGAIIRSILRNQA